MLEIPEVQSSIDFQRDFQQSKAEHHSCHSLPTSQLPGNLQQVKLTLTEQDYALGGKGSRGGLKQKTIFK